MKKKIRFFMGGLLLPLMPLISYSQTWQAIKSMSNIRDAAVSFSIGSYGFCGGGGETQDDFWKYNPVTNTWSQLANIPSTGGGRGYAVGVSDGKYAYVGFGQEGNSITNVQRDWWRYDTATNTWTQRASLPHAGASRLGAGSFVINGKIYVFGGGDSAYAYLHDCWVYDTGADTWTQLDTLPDFLGFPSSFAINGKGYFTCYESGSLGHESTNTYMYDTATKIWTKHANFPGIAREAGAAFILNNTGYVGLGQSQYTTVYSDFYSYNPISNQWDSVDVFGGDARAWPSAMVINGIAYVGVGSVFSGNSVRPLNNWWKFTPSSLSVTSIKASNGFICYPIPAKNFVVLANTSSGNMETLNYSLYNMVGQIVAQGKLTGTGDKYMLDISGISNGEYILSLKNNVIAIVSQKMVVCR